MAKRACKNCKAITEKNKCPICGSEQFSESYKGKLVVLNAEKSLIAQKTGKKVKGEYAIKN